MESKYRVKKSKGEYYIQERIKLYHYPPLIILTPLWYLYAYFFNKKLLHPYYEWCMSDRGKKFTTLQLAMDRIKVLSEPDQIFEYGNIYEGMNKPVQVRYTE